MKLLKQYLELQKEIHAYFGYVEDWVTIPLEDKTELYWYFDGQKVTFAKKEFTLELIEAGEEIYSGTLYRQRFLPKWEYRGEDYTMLVIDTHTDGNKYLMIFSNDKELKNPSPEFLKAFDKWKLW